MSCTRHWAVLAVVMAVTGCDREPDPTPTPEPAATRPRPGRGSTSSVPTAPPTDPHLRTIPSPVPSGEVEIIWACSHRAQPFGTSFWRHSHRYDLAAGKVHSERVEGDRSRSGAVSPDGGPKTTRTVRTLEPSQVARMRAALAGVLRGGPYRAEYPPPEGVSCRLALQLAGQPAFFTIDKARRLEKDEVNALIALLAGQP